MVSIHFFRYFDLFNPTSETYGFSWREKNIQEFSHFHCETPEGTAKSGQKTRMTFTFLSQDIGIFESSWEFLIKEEGVKVPFLLFGVVSQPRVTCCPTRIELESTVPGNNRFPACNNTYHKNQSLTPIHILFKQEIKSRTLLY